MKEPTMRGEIERRSRLPFWLLITAIMGVGAVIALVLTRHDGNLTRVQIQITMTVLAVSVPMLLAAVILSQRVKCPKCSFVLGYKNDVGSCPSCKVNFDEPMPTRPIP
jgi:uncharacterized membrane protein AbrB (regulator of aidB expression)